MKKITKKILSVLCAVLILAASVGTLAACGDGTSDTKYKLSDYFVNIDNRYTIEDLEAAEPSGERIQDFIECLADVRITRISFTADTSSTISDKPDSTPKEYVFTEAPICRDYKKGERIRLNGNYSGAYNLKITFKPL